VRASWLLLVLLPLGGCGSGDPGGAADAAAPQGDAMLAPGPLLPLAVGNRWSYRVTDPVTGVVSMKMNLVEAEEMVGGRGPNAARMAFRVKTVKLEAQSVDWVVSWQGREGDAVVRYRENGYQAVPVGVTPSRVTYETWWDRYKLRIDGSPERTRPGASYIETYQEMEEPTGSVVRIRTDMDIWTVVALSTPCTVPGRGQLACLEIRKAGTSMDAGKTYLFAPGVGKVKEIGRLPSGQNEDLVEYQLAGQ
jgi:hypothetical protein